MWHTLKKIGADDKEVTPTHFGIEKNADAIACDEEGPLREEEEEYGILSCDQQKTVSHETTEMDAINVRPSRNRRVPERLNDYFYELEI